MKIVVAVRAPTDSRARQWLASQALELIKSRPESQDPALRNLVDGLHGRGLAAETEAGGLFWFLVASPLAAAALQALEAVAAAFAHDWLLQQSLQIRYLKGMAYCDAAAAWAAFLPFADQPPAEPQALAMGGLDWQGLQCDMEAPAPAPRAKRRALPQAAAAKTGGAAKARARKAAAQPEQQLDMFG